MAAKKNKKTTTTRTRRNARNAATTPEVIDAGGGILVEIAPPPSDTPKAKRGKGKATPSPETKPQKLSALDAAAQVLADTGEPMNAKALIEAMAKKGLWTSPGGKTPHATLFAAILREINTKGKEARFTKASKGHFAATKNG